MLVWSSNHDSLVYAIHIGWLCLCDNIYVCDSIYACDNIYVCDSLYACGNIYVSGSIYACDSICMGCYIHVTM